MKNQAAVQLGSMRSEKKAQAARENGKLGGRPKVRPPPPPTGFSAHPQWDALAANGDGTIMRLYLNTPTPFWGECRQYNHPGGYLSVGVPRTGRIVCSHRVVYECCTGRAYAWSVGSGDGLTIDHINGEKKDNRIANLQILTNYENTAKARRRSGLPRYVSKRGNRYMFRIHTRNPRKTVESKSYGTLSELMPHLDKFLAKHGRTGLRRDACRDIAIAAVFSALSDAKVAAK